MIIEMKAWRLLSILSNSPKMPCEAAYGPATHNYNCLQSLMNISKPNNSIALQHCIANFVIKSILDFTELIENSINFKGIDDLPYKTPYKM